MVTSCVVNPFSDGVAPTEQCKPLDHWQTWVYIAANWLRNALTVMPRSLCYDRILKIHDHLIQIMSGQNLTMAGQI